MARKICGFLAAIALVVAPGLHWGVLKLRAAAQSSAQPANGVPCFQVDTSWPPKLPKNWVIGDASSVAVDRQGNVYVLHRPRTVPAEQILTC
jgi:hypothetical protein